MTSLAPALTAAAYFPGARSENEAWVRGEFQAVLDHWFDWRKGLFSDDPSGCAPELRRSTPFLRERELLSERLQALAEALTAETPTYSPRYLAHMKSDLSLPGLLGWFVAMLHNPNNTSQEASRVGSVIELEAIGRLAGMLGYDPARAQGHFTSGGTVANFEAVWRARYRLDHWLSMGLYVAEATGEPLDVFSSAHMGWDRFRALWTAHGLSDAVLRRCSAVAANPAEIYRRISRASGADYLGPVVLVPGNKHYSWMKAANLFWLGEDSFWSVALDREGRLDLADFERLVSRARLENRPILMCVGVAGATETGAVDPLHRLYDLMDGWETRRGWRIWRHVDAAYGGFFCSILGGPGEAVLDGEVVGALRAVPRADSVTIDPHKLGYVPYACGAFITPDKERYVVSAFDAPYLDRPELGPGKWSSTLEGSRSAAGAAATWLTAETLGLGPDRLGALLAGAVEARRRFQSSLTTGAPTVRVLAPADTNILCFSVAEEGEALSVSNARTEAIFGHFQKSPDFAVSKTTLGPDYAAQIGIHLARHDGRADVDRLVVIRAVFMNPYWCEEGTEKRLAPRFIAVLKEAMAQGTRSGIPPSSPREAA